MSKRAEDAALKVLPNFPPETYADEDEYIEVESDRRVQRAFYRKGYEQAEKDTIRTVKTWLSEIHRVCDITDENGYRVELRNLVASLEKTMEEE